MTKRAWQAEKALFAQRDLRSLTIGTHRGLSAALVLSIVLHAAMLYLFGLATLAPAHRPSSPAVTWVIDATSKTVPDSHRIAADNQRAGVGDGQQAPAHRHTPAAANARVTTVGDQPQKTPPSRPQTTGPPHHASGQKKPATHAGLAAKRDARAAYLAAWRNHIEHQGSEHFPSRRVIAGARQAPVVQVTIQPSGDLQSVRIVRSSGSAALDRAAEGIVHASAPFQALPKALRHGKGDTLRLSYEWHFLTQSAQDH